MPLSDAVVAKSRAERDRIWHIRDEVMRLWELEPIFIFDVSLPIRHMEDYLDRLDADLTARWPDAQMIVFGHLGDGNLHVTVSAGPADGSAGPLVEEAVYRPLQAIGGSVSAEHGIGLDKKPYLALCRNQAEIDLMRTLKRSLDPRNILNPGKIFDLNET